MTAVSTLRRDIESAILERHCAHHPMTQKWARGELSRNALMGWGIEHYHWISNIQSSVYYKLATAPPDAQQFIAANNFEENDPAKPHLPIVLRFAEANGANIDEVKRGRGLPTTEAWVAFQVLASKDVGWLAGVAVQVGTESQSPLLYTTVLPALREKYGFDEHSIEHFWLHAEADEGHGDRWFELLEQHCTTEELRQMAIYYARESAKMRWFYFDGIYLHYELGYSLR
jgi:pyrroloquinoline quinone (PQQ) biosynthesis protein C